MTLSIGPYARENIAAYIYRMLKQRLMMGALAPGEVLTLRSITDELNVSQTPVREALLQLASERVLSMETGRSIRVPELTLNDLYELRKIRLSLERMATEAAVPKITDAEISNLEAVHERMAAAKASENREETLRGNYDLHFGLYTAAAMPHLLSIIENLWAQTGPSLRHLYQHPFVHLEGTHPHLTLIKALRQRDTSAAVAAIELDVAGYGNALMAKLEEIAAETANADQAKGKPIESLKPTRKKSLQP